MYSSIVNLLQQSRLKEAQTQAEALLDLCGDWTLTNQLEQNRTSYNYMLDYMRQGINDPQREKLYLRLRTDLWDIADRARIQLLDKVSTHYYHELRRTQVLLPPDPSLKEQLAELESIVDDIDLCQLPPYNNNIPDDLRRRHETASRRVFISTWISDPWTDEQVNQADLWLESDIVDTHDISLLTSAVGMSLLEWFDPRKMQWLLSASVSFENESRERALVGVALALLQYGDRIPLYPDLTETIRKHAAELWLGKRLNTVYLQLLRCRETDDINRKMQEEILPTMLKNKELFSKFKRSLEEEYEGDVPNWAEAIDRLGLNDKIREMNDLQMEGKDIYMSTFAPLKSHPFFNDLPNWFRPFDVENSAIPAELRQNGTFQQKLKLFFEIGTLCDSDKYSLAFMLQHLPQAQRDLMFAQLSNEALEEMKDDQHLDKLRNFANLPQTISNQYLQDLYRFFKLSRYKGQITDPFREDIDLYANPVLSIVLDSPGQARTEERDSRSFPQRTAVERSRRHLYGFDIGIAPLERRLREGGVLPPKAETLRTGPQVLRTGRPHEPQQRLDPAPYGHLQPLAGETRKCTGLLPGGGHHTTWQPWSTLPDSQLPDGAARIPRGYGPLLSAGLGRRA